MRVLAYTSPEIAESTRRAIGVRPATCPPHSAAELPPLAPCDLLYIGLHGGPGEIALYGIDRQAGDDHLPGERIPALTCGQIRYLPLHGAIVFLASCYGADRGAPIVRAFLDAGASAVIAGHGVNPAGTAGGKVVGSALLARWLLYGLRLGLEVSRAMALAKARLRLAPGWPAKDAREFKIYMRGGDHGRY